MTLSLDPKAQLFRRHAQRMQEFDAASPAIAESMVKGQAGDFQQMMKQQALESKGFNLLMRMHKKPKQSVIDEIK
jgi:hypothetical protein